MGRLISLVAFVAVVFAGGLAAGGVRAEGTWVQIEARPTLAEAQDRARAYGGAFGNVAGFRLNSGWYGIVLGPFDPDEAQRQLDLLRGEKMIPRDSFIAPTATLRQQFWPDASAEASITAPTPTTDAQAEAPAPVVPAPATDPIPATDPTATPDTATAEESPAEARAAEAALSAQDRQDVQSALQFYGDYQGAIDGSFGPGTRNSMATWQGRKGDPATGTLTSAQRTSLIEGWKAELTALGLTRVTEAEAGIGVDLPMGLIQFDHYSPPFVTYKSKDGSGYQVLLISRRGDGRSLSAIFDQVQGLAIVPTTGERELRPASFTIEGSGQTGNAYAQASVANGLVKGFVLIWPTGDDDRAARILAAMKTSFTSQINQALDEDLGQPSSVSQADLTSGLAVRRPVMSRSGVFVDQAGMVLTTAEVVRQCGRVTLNDTQTADVVFEDDKLGIALLKPQTPLAPRAVAELQPVLPNPTGQVAVAGYSYEGKLDAPVVSFGTFAEARGLHGEDTLSRLAIRTLPGDAGAAVLNDAGAMTGLLLPAADDSGRELPPGVGFALNADAIATALTGHGVTLTPSAATTALAPEDLAAKARNMTVLVSCWK